MSIANLSKEIHLLDVALMCVCVRVVGCMDLAVDSNEKSKLYESFSQFR